MAVSAMDGYALRAADAALRGARLTGVAASPLAGLLARACSADLDRAGRVTVEPDLTLRGYPEVLALGAA